MFWLDQDIMVAAINHPKGTSFTFDESRPPSRWAWQQMVAQLDEDAMRLVVEGEGTNADESGNSRGIISCALLKTEIPDHKRHAADRTNGTAVAGRQYFVWDFMLTREDDSYVILHPNYSNRKVECKLHTSMFDGEVPRTGLGGTSGPGTFQRFIKKNVDRILRFDAKKKITARIGNSPDCGCVESADGPAFAWQ